MPDVKLPYTEEGIEMAKDLKSGKTFAQAHTRAMRKVGK